MLRIFRDRKNGITNSIHFVLSIFVTEEVGRKLNDFDFFQLMNSFFFLSFFDLIAIN